MGKRNSTTGTRESNVQAFSVREFFARFPTNEACLEHVMSVRYGLRHTCGKCGVIEATFHRLANRPAYSCAHCAAHVYPCAEVFQRQALPLTVWLSAARCGPGAPRTFVHRPLKHRRPLPMPVIHARRAGKRRAAHCSSLLDELGPLMAWAPPRFLRRASFITSRRCHVQISGPVATMEVAARPVGH